MSTDGYINLSGEDIRRNKAIVQEVLELTGHVLKQTEHPKSEIEKAFRRLAQANISVAQVIGKYYEDHPLMTNVPELTKIVQDTLVSEFLSLSKDDLFYLFVLQQTKLVLKKFGYE